VRANAGTSYAKLGAASKGKTYAYLGSKKASNGRVWYQIQFTASKKGWVSSGYAKLIEVAAPTTTAQKTTATKPTTAATKPAGPTQTALPSYIRRMICVKKSGTKVYSAPGSYNRQMGTVSAGARYLATGWKNDKYDVTWYSFSWKGKTVWISRFNVTVSDSYTAIPEKNFRSGGTPMIYLSPSRQPHNAYAVRTTNEQAQMYRVGRELYNILKNEYVCNVYLAPTTLELGQDGRALDAYRRHADVYLAIHSNADPKVDRSHYGPMGFYFPGSTQSKRLAQNVVAEMSKIAPRGATVSPNVVNGMAAFDHTGYTDVRDPSNYGMASVLAEVEFHDKSDSARWIMDHPKAIARALANALEKTFGLRKK
jgi:N-acetylmuramoyl-L-alanine amidase